MSGFVIEITDEVLACHPRQVWHRMVEFIDSLDPDGVYMSGYQNFDRWSWTYRGDGPPELVTVLMAAARGDDLSAVLDRLGARVISDGTARNGGTAVPEPPASAAAQLAAVQAARQALADARNKKENTDE